MYRSSPSRRANPTDLLGEGFCKRRLQESINRNMFYCWADKRGTKIDERGKECTVGNYEPCWANATCIYNDQSGRPKNCKHKCTRKITCTSAGPPLETLAGLRNTHNTPGRPAGFKKPYATPGTPRNGSHKPASNL